MQGGDEGAGAGDRYGDGGRRQGVGDMNAGAETSGQDVVFMLTVAEGYSTNDLGYLSRDALKLPTRMHTS